MAEKYYLGIDAGGTSCKARLVDEYGQVLSQYKGGAANLRLGVDKVLDEIITAASECLKAIGRSQDDICQLHVGAGMAGVSHSINHKTMLQEKQPFASFRLKSDAYIACLSAHKGKDGGIIISGTGSCGFYLKNGEETIIGGHGFMLGDQGGGANLGRQTLRQSLLSFDGLAPRSDLSQKIMQHFENDPRIMLKWAEAAKPVDYAHFAKYCVEAYFQDNPLAQKLVEETLQDLSMLIDAVFQQTQTPVGIIGGLGMALKQRLMVLNPDKIMEDDVDNLSGAVLLAMQPSRAS